MGNFDGGNRRGGGNSRPFGRRRGRKVDPFLVDSSLEIDYKEPKLLKRFLADNGKILPRRMTGLTAKHQRKVAKAIKLARQVALLPYPGHDA